MNAEDVRVFGAARATLAQDGVARRLIRCLGEELAERGMRKVLGERSENDFAVTRHLDFAALS